MAQEVGCGVDFAMERYTNRCRCEQETAQQAGNWDMASCGGTHSNLPWERESRKQR